jgi:pyruvate formate lyase activating enzyme
MTNTLRVMEVERFAIHDGPGIRTVVFLQGCPLRCPWCANPESQIIKKQLMYKENKCVKGCNICIEKCPKNAIRFIGDKLVFNRSLCGDCQLCGDECPHGAIVFSGVNKSIEDIMTEVMRDKDYYEYSEGGITVSGGEPFVQYEGFLGLLKESKRQGLHTAVETTGNVDMANLIEAEPYIDLFLFDMKHVDNNKLKEVTNGDFDIIIRSLEYISSKNSEKIIIRVPVIPSFNYDDDTIEEIFRIAQKNKIREVHLLPYHTLGKNKYEQIGKKYELTNIKMLNKSELSKYVDIGNKKGLRIVIGG